MKHQEDEQYAQHSHGDAAHHPAHPPSGNHHQGHHHGFKGIEQWIARLDHPERAKQQLPNEVIAKLQLQPSDVVADIGAGTGYFAIRIAEAYPQVRVIAADAEPEMIRYLKGQAAARNLANLEPILIDPAKPQLPARANLALIVDTLHHVHNRVEFLNALKENLTPGARIAVIDYAVEAVEGPPADHRLAVNEVVEELKGIGYTLAQNFNFLPHQYFLIFQHA